MTQLIISMIRCATPILLAALGGIICERVGVFNIALEGMMLFGCFFAIYGSYLTGSAWIGALAAMAVCGAIGFIFVKLTEDLGAEPTITGIGINTLALGMTTYLMKMVFGEGGSISAGNKISGFQRIEIPFIKEIPVIGEILSGYTPLVYLTFILVPVLAFLLYRTHMGIGLRAVGEEAHAAQAAGLSVSRFRVISLIVAGMLCGLAGAHLSLGYVTLFSENMTNGRGFFAYVAVVFGKADPVSVMIAALVFGLADTLSTKVQGNGIPSSLVLMLPYVVTILALMVRSTMTGNGRKLFHSNLKTKEVKQ